MNILAIDDNEDILKLLNTIITSKGHDFTQSGNGKEGVKLIEEQNFDAILLDLAMPECYFIRFGNARIFGYGCY
jgi:CheY-like chemotaxis protein